MKQRLNTASTGLITGERAFAAAKSWLRAGILLAASWLAMIGYAAADGPKMIHVFATVSGHKITQAYEANDTIIVLDVISVPQNTAYNPTLQVAAINFVKSHLKELGLTSVDPNSVFIGGGGNSDSNQAINARKRHLNELEKRSLPNLGWLKFVGTQHGEWFVDMKSKAGTIIDPKTGLQWSQTDNGSGIGWDEAVTYCNAKGSGWGLPNVTQLQALYDDSQSQRCGTRMCSVSSKFRLNGEVFWSKDREDSSQAWHVNLGSVTHGAYRVEHRGTRLVLCVRRP